VTVFFQFISDDLNSIIANSATLYHTSKRAL
jgi:hypothetical protein